VTDTPRPGELDLARLRYKYETILELRLRDQSGASPTTELRALSQEFPGALRPLDSLTLANIHDRIDTIVSAELDPAQIAPWMIAELTFAQAMRGLLAAKAWLRGRKELDAEMRVQFEAEAPQLRDGLLALVWRADLVQIAQPTGGRLVPLAIMRVAAALSISGDEATALLFREDGRARDQDLLGVDGVEPLELDPPLSPEEPPLPPPPSDFLLELSVLGEDDEDDESELPPAGGEPDGLDDE